MRSRTFTRGRNTRHARMAKDNTEIDARIGEMMAEQPKNEGGRPRETGLSENPVLKPVTLAEAGIDKNLAHAARQLAEIPKDDFEYTLTAWREHLSAENGRVTLDLLSADGRRGRYFACAIGSG